MRVRLSERAEDDLRNILKVSFEQHGLEAKTRYENLITTALQRLVDDPGRMVIVARLKRLGGFRSLHLRHVDRSGRMQVRRPVHVFYYRLVEPDIVEVVRVLHERMEPARHIAGSP